MQQSVNHALPHAKVHVECHRSMLLSLVHSKIASNNVNELKGISLSALTYVHSKDSRRVCSDTYLELDTLELTQYNPLFCFYIAHQTVSLNTSSILVPFFSWWTWCAVLHFAKNGPKPGLTALKSKTHARASVCRGPWK